MEGNLNLVLAFNAGVLILVGLLSVFGYQQIEMEVRYWGFLAIFGGLILSVLSLPLLSPQKYKKYVKVSAILYIVLSIIAILANLILINVFLCFLCDSCGYVNGYLGTSTKLYAVQHIISAVLLVVSSIFVGKFLLSQK